MKVCLALFLFLFPLLLQAGTVYKSIGANGQIVYSDQPPLDGKVDKKLNFTNLPATPISGARGKSGVDSNAKAASSSVKSDGNQPVLFMAQWCGYCKQAKSYLNARHISYVAYDIDTADGMSKMNAAGGGKGIPVLLWHGQKISGYSRDAYDAVFKSYPD